MALTITYDGYGVVANADSLTNDTGGSGTGDWKELGGGSYSLSPDASKYGVASIGSKYASKSGYTYIDGITALDFSGGGAQEGEMIYIWVMMLSPTPLDDMNTDPYNICIGSATGSLNEYTVASKADSNGWDGRWRVFAIDPTVTPTINGGADLSAIDTIGIWIDTDTSVRAESFYISQILCAKGLKVEGSSSTLYDDIVIWAEDYANRAAGMFQSRGQTYFSLGSLTIHSDSGNTTVLANGSNVEYEKCEFYNGTSWGSSYPLTANVIATIETNGNQIDLTDTNIGLAGNEDNMLSIDSSLGTTYTKIGGYLKYLDGLDATSSDVFNGVVISNYTIRTLGAEEYKSCIFDGSASVTLDSGSDFANGNTMGGYSGVDSLITSELSYLSTTKIISSGSNHGVQLTSVGGGSMTWNCVTTDFDSGSAGSPVTPTSTGNEDIYISASSGTIDISVADGATTPSIRSAGATVNVISGQITIEITSVIVGSSVHVATLDGNGSESTVIINEVASTSTVSTSVTYSSLDYTDVAIKVRKSTDCSAVRYLPYKSYGVIGVGGMSVSANQAIDHISSCTSPTEITYDMSSYTTK